MREKLHQQTERISSLEAECDLYETRARAAESKLRAVLHELHELRRQGEPTSPEKSGTPAIEGQNEPDAPRHSASDIVSHILEGV